MSWLRILNLVWLSMCRVVLRIVSRLWLLMVFVFSVMSTVLILCGNRCCSSVCRRFRRLRVDYRFRWSRLCVVSVLFVLNWLVRRVICRCGPCNVSWCRLLMLVVSLGSVRIVGRIRVVVLR